MKYKIWNKQDSINNCNADYILKSLNAFKDDEIFLVLDKHDNVIAIEIARIIKSVYKLNTNLTVQEVAQAYIAKRLEQEQKMENDKNTIEMQAEKIEVLEQEQADFLLDSIEKDSKLDKLDKDLAELTLEIVGGI